VPIAARPRRKASSALGRFANRIGLLFQVVDDILDAEASTATLGKTAGKDAANNKPTYVNILGLNEAKAMAASLRQDAHDGTGVLSATPPRACTNCRLHRRAYFLMTHPLLDKINFPADLRALERDQLPQVADELRAFVLESVSKTGGHLSSNLGTVELTVALHYVFDTPEDRLVWDVGHQTYPHKVLTGRARAWSACA
jgi:hypothetical protein